MGTTTEAASHNLNILPRPSSAAQTSGMGVTVPPPPPTPSVLSSTNDSIDDKVTERFIARIKKGQVSYSEKKRPSALKGRTIGPRAGFGTACNACHFDKVKCRPMKDPPPGIPLNELPCARCARLGRECVPSTKESRVRNRELWKEAHKNKELIFKKHGVSNTSPSAIRAFGTMYRNAIRRKGPAVKRSKRSSRAGPVDVLLGAARMLHEASSIGSAHAAQPRSSIFSTAAELVKTVEDERVGTQFSSVAARYRGAGNQYSGAGSHYEGAGVKSETRGAGVNPTPQLAGGSMGIGHGMATNRGPASEPTGRGPPMLHRPPYPLPQIRQRSLSAPRPQTSLPLQPSFGTRESVPVAKVVPRRRSSQRENATTSCFWCARSKQACVGGVPCKSCTDKLRYPELCVSVAEGRAKNYEKYASPSSGLPCRITPGCTRHFKHGARCSVLAPNKTRGLKRPRPQDNAQNARGPTTAGKSPRQQQNATLGVPRHNFEIDPAGDDSDDDTDVQHTGDVELA